MTSTFQHIAVPGFLLEAQWVTGDPALLRLFPEPVGPRDKFGCPTKAKWNFACTVVRESNTLHGFLVSECPAGKAFMRGLFECARQVGVKRIVWTRGAGEHERSKTFHL